jgi:tetratricopeptide (TPR) repeat protein
MSEADLDVDARLAELDKKETECTHSCRYRSANRIAAEIRRTAKAERRLTPYIRATFTLMNNATALLEPEVGRDASIELIGLLESEDRARAIQPDFNEGEYRSNVDWFSSCAYDNLATATAALAGHNSEGTHACIADGIQVCRRTGKMQCVTCFREYATEVYRAADDLEMALHFARAGVSNDRPGPHDRRWAGAKDMMQVFLLQGRLTDAMQAAEKAWELSSVWHNVVAARLQMSQFMRELACLSGEPNRWDELLASAGDLKSPDTGEWRWYELRGVQVEAVVACCEGRYKDALEPLTAWDQRLLQSKNVREWFDHRLRLLAVHRLVGNDALFSRLASQLETKARPARDWLTLRCLTRLKDAAIRPTPVPTTADLSSGPFAASAASTQGAASQAPPPAADDARPDEQDSSEAPADDGGPPPAVRAYWQRRYEVFEQAGDDAEAIEAGLLGILGEMQTADASVTSTAEDTTWVLHTARFMLTDGAEGSGVWKWAESIAARHPDHAAVMNLLATLGAALEFDGEGEPRGVVARDRLEELYRASLDLDPNHARNFGRAGDFHQLLQNVGEAERCFARALRLDRADGESAKKLAMIYRGTDRQRDALAVLDMCLREGCTSAELQWQAGLDAFNQGQFEACLTYLEAFDAQTDDEPWVHYYRAGALLQLGRFDEAAVAVAEEIKRNPECPYPSAVQRAAVAAGLGDLEDFRTQLSAVMAMPLREVDYFTRRGLAATARLLWNAAVGILPADDAQLTTLADRNIAAGIAPDEVFAGRREHGEVCEGVNFYEVLMRQPLDERWAEWHGRLSGEEELPAYVVTWGVLARNEEEAQQLALEAQQCAFPLAAEPLEVNSGEQGFRDRVGVVWLGWREGVGPN